MVCESFRLSDYIIGCLYIGEIWYLRLLIVNPLFDTFWFTFVALSVKALVWLFLIFQVSLSRYHKHTRLSNFNAGCIRVIQGCHCTFALKWIIFIYYSLYLPMDSHPASRRWVQRLLVCGGARLSAAQVCSAQLRWGLCD